MTELRPALPLDIDKLRALRTVAVQEAACAHPIGLMLASVALEKVLPFS
ncbi:hypothetical protein [Janthinobacterium sp. PC23-8]|nr:hypothetical protein [Janthinobacterium sp. PC23-8]